MNNISFMQIKTYNNGTKEKFTFTRITKANARKQHNNGNTIYLLPCKANPNSYFIDFYELNEKADFDKYVNCFEYHNCCTELGKYTSFYTMSSQLL